MGDQLPPHAPDWFGGQDVGYSGVATGREVLLFQWGDEEPPNDGSFTLCGIKKLFILLCSKLQIKSK
ncbi:hypothetical protein [Rummeliibacillus sp. SL167]|uniref:hypothetical protein n=1 Tax=Rummeliibacillus sp. SL167 TaxID=2579792 RepID=UPI0011B4A006|nr:hypothetical protein [Rummeliibacillus sp. SL167]